MKWNKNEVLEMICLTLSENEISQTSFAFFFYIEHNNFLLEKVRKL